MAAVPSLEREHGSLEFRLAIDEVQALGCDLEICTGAHQTMDIGGGEDAPNLAPVFDIENFERTVRFAALRSMTGRFFGCREAMARGVVA